MKKLRLAALGTVFILSISSMVSAISPKGPGGRFSFQNLAEYDLTLEDWASTPLDFSHMGLFLLITLLGLFGLGRRPYLTMAAYVLILIVAIEGLQMWTPSRDCRLIDSIPSLLGFSMACAVFRAASKSRQAKKSETRGILT